MNTGDLVARIDWDGQLNTRLLGVILEINIDKKLLGNPFGVPWIYRVHWNDGITKDHEMGTLRRVAVKQ